MRKPQREKKSGPTHLRKFPAKAKSFSCGRSLIFSNWPVCLVIILQGLVFVGHRISIIGMRSFAASLATRSERCARNAIKRRETSEKRLILLIICKWASATPRRENIAFSLCYPTHRPKARSEKFTRTLARNLIRGTQIWREMPVGAHERSSSAQSQQGRIVYFGRVMDQDHYVWACFLCPSDFCVVIKPWPELLPFNQKALILLFLLAWIFNQKICTRNIFELNFYLFHGFKQFYISFDITINRMLFYIEEFHPARARFGP